MATIGATTTTTGSTRASLLMAIFLCLGLGLLSPAALGQGGLGQHPALAADAPRAGLGGVADAGGMDMSPSCADPQWAEGLFPVDGVDGWVRALTVFDNGAGAALYAGGGFSTAGGVAANSIGRWDGSAWSPLGSGVSGVVLTLTVLDDGTSPALYAGGDFWTAGGVAANSIGRWDGSAWSPLSSGMGGTVEALTVFDGGSGAALYAGGDFWTAGGEAANRTARWDGSAWSPLGTGMNDWVAVLTVFDDGAGPALFAGGAFTSAGGVGSGYLARWGCKAVPCYADCDGDGELTFFDFLCFQSLFAAGDPGADCDGDETLTFFDFLCFQNAFVAGCE